MKDVSKFLAKKALGRAVVRSEALGMDGLSLKDIGEKLLGMLGRSWEQLGVTFAEDLPFLKRWSQTNLAIKNGL